MSAELNFSYDQVIESYARLHGFSASEIVGVDSDGDVEEDIDHIGDLLARRDLVIFAASIRNFSEITRSIGIMKEARRIELIRFDRTVPFPFQIKTGNSINLYQAASRVLHSHDSTILRSMYGILLDLNTGDIAEYFNEIEKLKDHKREAVSACVILSTEKEGRTSFLLDDMLIASRHYLDAVLKQLEHKKIFLSRSFRDM